MARQRPRTDCQAHWIPTARMPQELGEQGALAWAVAHQQAHPWCWAWRAPGVHTITVQSRKRTLAGGHVTFSTFVPPSPPPTSPADPQALLQQAVQQALAAPQPPSTGQTPANGMASAATSPASQADWCLLHQAPMEQRRNAKGTWSSHWLASEQHYCKGK